MEIDYGTSACNFNMGYWSSSNNEQQYYGKESTVMCVDGDVLSSSFPATTTTTQLHQPPPASSLDNYSVNDVPILDEMFLLNVDPFSLSPDHNTDLVVPYGFWNELMKTEDQLNQLLLLGSSNNNMMSNDSSKKKAAPAKKRRPRRGADHAKTSTRAPINNKTKKLSRETISQYFCMPIIKAAKELDVGLTLLKKRCRELGIQRWPHRKINSLQTLIKNVQEFETTTDQHNGPSSSALKKENLEKLEQEKKLLEEIPDMQLDHTTKRLRQAFFKANYKKRKLMNNMGSALVLLVDSPSSIQSSQASTAIIADHENDDDSEDEELKYLLDDCFSSCTTLY